MERLFIGLQKERIINVNMEALSIDSITVKVHPNGIGVLKKWKTKNLRVNRRTYSEDTCGCHFWQNDYQIWNNRWTSAWCTQTIQLLIKIIKEPENKYVIMDRAYEAERKNTVERFFSRLKRFQRIFTRYDKLDLMFCIFIYFVLIIDILVWTDCFY